MLTKGTMSDGVGLEILCELPDFVGAVDSRHPCFYNYSREDYISVV